MSKFSDSGLGPIKIVPRGFIAVPTGTYFIVSVVLTSVLTELAIDEVTAKPSFEEIESFLIIFFMCSNFGVWVFSEFYTKDLEGLLQCYVLAIPFFTNTIISTIVFGMLFEIVIMSKNKVTSLLYK